MSMPKLGGPYGEDNAESIPRQMKRMQPQRDLLGAPCASLMEPFLLRSCYGICQEKDFGLSMIFLV